MPSMCRLRITPWLLAAALLACTLPQYARADGPSLQLHMVTPVSTCLALTGTAEGQKDPCDAAAFARTDAMQCFLVNDAKLMPRLAQLMLGPYMERWHQKSSEIKWFLDEEPDLARTRAKLDWYYPQYDVMSVAQAAAAEAVVSLADALGEQCLCALDGRQTDQGPDAWAERMLQAVQASPRVCALPVNAPSDGQPLSMALPASVDVLRQQSAGGNAAATDSKQDKCIFLLGVGRTGTSSLVKYLNVYKDDCLMYGENASFMRHLRSFVSDHIIGLLGSQHAALRFARRIFNAFYKRTEHKCVGFKEVRYGMGPYWEFEDEVAFLGTMCKRPFFVFHYSEDMDRTLASQHENWHTKLHEGQRIIANQVSNFKRFAEENPGLAFVSTKESTFQDPTALMKFLEHPGEAPPFTFVDVNNVKNVKRSD